MTTKMAEGLPQPEIPPIIVDPSPRSHTQYEKGRFLGKGGFAKCYELKNLSNGEIVAGKIVPKSLLVKQNQKDKMAQEISLHRQLSHPYIVQMFSYFEDSNFVYIVLELCRRRSLMELHKRRKAVTEPETRYFMNQIILGVKYLHGNKIIHRDLKLGNIFLNDNMEIKIGDFGLATKVDFDGERKRTLCGTPNYIAPEVLCKKGHSYEVDIWSIGCILYTLLVGKPPFETQTLKDTYARIKKNEYHVPSRIGPLAKKLISRLLQAEPERRPTCQEILSDEFLTLGYMPQRLPTSCLTMAPRFDTKDNQTLIARRGPFTEINQDPRSTVITVPVNPVKDNGASSQNQVPKDYYLSDLKKQLASVCASNPATRLTPILEDEAEDPKVAPMVWISKWVDYSDKYGFGYALCDESIGVVYNDLTKLVLLSDGTNMHYIEHDGTEYYFTMNSFPTFLDKKVKLLNYFMNYMKEHLLKAGANIKMRDGDELSRIPALRTWFRTSRAVVMHLTNGTLQINFFKDHTKIILCPLLGGITYIDEDRNPRTYSLELIEKYGCNAELASRLAYSLEKVEIMLNTPKMLGTQQPSTQPTPRRLPVVIRQ